MIRRQQGLVAALIGMAGLMVVQGASTNDVPWNDSFEDYPGGTALASTNGWSSSVGGAVVTNDTAVTDLLPNYPVDGKSYPLPTATHTNVLRITDVTLNDLRSVSNGVVVLDALALPTWMATPPAGDVNMQCNFCISTNARITLWHYNVTGASNEWRELVNSPSVPSNAWSRFTLVADYANAMFQLRVNEGTAISDDAGWSAASNGVAGGPWFHMVQTNGHLSGLRVEGAPAYLDDVQVTNRSLTWSVGGVTESDLNDGTVAGTPAFTITLNADTFNGAADEDFVATGKVETNNVPAGLTAVVRRTTATLATVTFTGTATQHEGVDSISNLTIRFTDAAFGYGSGWDVAGYQMTNLTVTFLDTPLLTWSTNAFLETIANNGALDNSDPLLINLTNGVFNGTLSEDFGTNVEKMTFPNLPAGLTAEAILMSPTQVRVRLLDAATGHASINSRSDVGIVFQNGAFVTVPASSVFNVSTNVSITFRDPGVLTYAATVFTETAANLGEVSGTTLSLTEKLFDATNDEDMVASGKITGANVPDGLTLRVVATDSAHATLTLAGNATHHAASNSIDTLGITFDNTAFVGGGATSVSNASLSNLQVQFNDPATVSAVPTTFTEASANDGSIGNTVTVTLTGDAFVNEAFLQDTHYTVTNVPGGMAFSLAYVDDTHVTATLSGNATTHTSAASLTNLQVTFLDAAFMAVAGTNMTGNPFDLNVTFADAPILTYSGNTFSEVSGGIMDNRTPITIMLEGETFSGTNGEDFVASNYIAAPNVPDGLTARIVRDSATQLSITLTGRATSHGSDDTITNLTFTFQNGAFASTVANEVTGYTKNNLSVVFYDESGFFNVIPYEEPFEAYANGTLMNGTNGWTAAFDPAAAMVTNDAGMTSLLLDYLDTHAQLPVSGDHTQILSVKSTVQGEIHSESFQQVFVDFMVFPMPMASPPAAAPTNLQCAAYIGTNSELVIWHHVTAPVPTNVWLTLTGAPTINTSQWLRLTIEQDYTHNMFQVRVNESTPVVDAQGWTAGGVEQPGSWFHMVQTNGSMSGFMLSGGGQIFLDDLTVKTSLPGLFGNGGSVFRFR